MENFLPISILSESVPIIYDLKRKNRFEFKFPKEFNIESKINIGIINPINKKIGFNCELNLLSLTGVLVTK